MFVYFAAVFISLHSKLFKKLEGGKVMKKIRCLLFFVVSLMFVFAMTGCGSQTAGTQEKGAGSAAPSKQDSKGEKPKSYKIGVNLELSGAASVWGIPQNEAIKMAANEINQKGGINGVPLEIISYDNESKETQSLIVTKKLVEQDKVLAVIGGGTTPTTMPLLPYVEKKNVPVVSVGSGDGITSPVEKRKWVFKTPSDNADLAVSITDFLEKQGKKQIAFMSVNNAYGESGKKTFEEVAKQRGIEIIAEEKFGATDKDMKPQLTNIKAKNPQAIVVWAIPPAASIVNKNYWELKMNNTLIYSAGAGSNAFINLAGREAADGTYIASGKVWVANQLEAGDKQKEVVTNYVKNFEEKTKKGASPIDGMAYDAMLLISKAIEQAGDTVTGDSIREQLEKINNLVGVTGIFNLSPKDHQGLKPEDIVIVQAKKDGWLIAK
jgi:branched-chain amino acid transport system substrate-binding protein